MTRPPRILRADDSVEDRIVFKDIPSGTLCAVYETNKGEGALASFASSLYDVALIGGRMEGPNGRVAVGSIRQWECGHQLGHTPIFALTAAGFDGEADRSRESGCDAQVSKPVRPAALLQAIGRLAAGDRAAR